MIPFDRAGDDLFAELDDFEVSLIESLVGQIVDLIGGATQVAPAPGASEDPFSMWAQEFSSPTLDRKDPVIARLFPDAYDDELEAAEHRRYSQEGLRRGRVDAASVVLADLRATLHGEKNLVIPDDHVDAWLKTLNSVRIALAVRLGIESEEDHAELERLGVRDPRAQLVALYDWMGAFLESLLEAAHGW